MTAALERNTWTPNLLPAAPLGSGEVGTLVPFGLTAAEPITAGDPTELQALRYDPARQISLGGDGEPAVTDNRHILRAGTSTDTNEDSQWWTDKD